MYTQHFSLTSEPFALTPDPAFLYLSPSHAEALAALKVGLQSRRGFMVMTGEVGTGKTTLLYSLLHELGSQIHCAYVANTKLSFDEILRVVLADFGLPTNGGDRVEHLEVLNAFLGRCAAQGVSAALVVDEAQNLDDDVFENLRLLSNFETFNAKLLQIVLVGQPELGAKLRRPALRQVAERIAVHCHVNPLSRHESRTYLAHRLRCAGGSPRLFTSAARRLVFRKAQGIPRRINILCYNALLFAYGRGMRRASRAQVRAAVREREGHGLVTLRRPAPWPRRGWLRPAIGALGLASLGATMVVLLVARPQHLEADRPAFGEVAVEAPSRDQGANRHRRAEPSGADASAAAAPAVAAVAAIGPEGQTETNEPPFVMPAEAGIQGDGAGRAEGWIPAFQSVDFPEKRASTSSARAVDNLISKDLTARPEPVEGPVPGFSTRSFAETTEAVGPAVPAVSPAIGDAERRAIVIQPGTSLEKLLREMYGTVSPQLLQRVRAVNPQITDVNHILAGDTLLFPDADVAPHSQKQDDR